MFSHFLPLLVILLRFEHAILSPAADWNGIYQNEKTGDLLSAEETVPAGATVLLTCFDGFHLSHDGVSTSICSNTDGRWYNEFGQCLPVCGRPPFVENGKILDGDSVVGSRRKVICADGYALLHGPDTIICHPQTKNWTTPGHCISEMSNSWMASQFSKISPSPMGQYRFAAVAADAGECSQIGTAILAEGGSAVDAAVATVICDGAVNMHFGGIGGGIHMTIWDQAQQKAFTVDGREVAPLASTEDMFESGQLSSTVGPFAIAVPGTIAALSEAHKRFGRLPWKRLFEPTISLCMRGITISKSVEIAIDEMMADPSVKDKNQNLATAEFKKLMMNPATGRYFRAGEVMKWPKLADTMTRIADRGAAEFYNGQLANDIVADLRDIGSLITSVDLRTYKPVWRQPIEMPLGNTGVKMFAMRPPGSGAILGFILNILSGYNLTKNDAYNPLTYHRYIEALKFAYSKRTYLGDENFLPDMEQFVANLTSPAFGAYVRSQIGNTTRPTQFYAPDLQQQPRTNGTSHMSVVDGNGNAVAVTSTINTYFGSFVVGSRTGILFNDEMDDFSTSSKPNSWGLVQSRANRIRPGKRPTTSMCPSIFVQRRATDGSYRVRLTVGVAGGSKITSSVAYIAMRVLFFGESVKQAVDAPRIHHQLYPEAILYEKSGLAPYRLLSVLSSTFGHTNQTEYGGSYFSIGQAIELVPAYSTDASRAGNEDYEVRAISDYRQPQGYTDGF